MTLKQSYLFNKKLRESRPRLSLIAPLTHKIVLGFVVFNLWIAYAILSEGPVSLVIFQGIFNNMFWASTFIFMAIVLAFGLYKNAWGVIRFGMNVGVFIKALFTYSFIVLGIHTGFSGLLGVLVLWGFAVWVQIVTVIYFTPNGTSHHATRDINQ